jgi:hypothetical protein
MRIRSACRERRPLAPKRRTSRCRTLAPRRHPGRPVGRRAAAAEGGRLCSGSGAVTSVPPYQALVRFPARPCLEMPCGRATSGHHSPVRASDRGRMGWLQRPGPGGARDLWIGGHDRVVPTTTEGEVGVARRPHHLGVCIHEVQPRAANRRRISSGKTSSMRVCSLHGWPNGYLIRRGRRGRRRPRRRSDARAGRRRRQIEPRARRRRRHREGG